MSKENVPEGGQKNERAARSFLTALFFAFTLFFFGPYEFYLSNYEQITIGTRFLMIALVPVSLAVFAVTFLLCLSAKGRAEPIVNAAVFGAALAFYLQGNYLSMGMGELDGSRYEPSALRLAVNTVIWLALLVLTVIAAKRRASRVSARLLR